MKKDRTILRIEWKVEDIITAMHERGMEPSEKVIQEFLKAENKNIKFLEEQSIAAGWDVIYTWLDNYSEYCGNDNRKVTAEYISRKKWE